MHVCASVSADARADPYPHLIALRQSYCLNHKEVVLALMAGHLFPPLVLGLQAHETLLSFYVGPGFQAQALPHACTDLLPMEQAPQSEQPEALSCSCPSHPGRAYQAS